MNKIKILIVMFLLALTACKPKPQVVVSETVSKAYYTCSMHPQVHEDRDGNCPICGMKLIKVEMTGTMSNMGRDKIILTATQIQLAAIQTDTIKEQNTGNEKTLTGTVTTNETAAQELSARLGGRIQKLFVRSVGETIAIGQPVYAIYSEDLQEAEKEYLLAKQQQKLLHNPDVDYKQLINAAESKLQLWGLTPSQINSLEALGKVSATTVILSKVSGTVSEIAVHEGDYVTEGMTVLKTQSLNNLWVEAQLYANETNNYKVNDRVNVSFPDLGGQIIAGKVEFINPELSETSKVDLIRISISNSQGLIRPGMLAYLTIGGTGNKALAVPASAVLTEGRGSRVWVKNRDGSFSSKMIKVGLGNQNYVSVTSGLSIGEIVVTNGAYLLNSEAIFKNGTGDKNAGIKM
ncbi:MULTISPECIES: efflux RND transporter periplasmic adaptor subunit [unclassified Mucilaginibacter]|uniref:efflux RND transporter periplasmic adaptor subunit n=1 Tax=unclassified Mucilaginibacter TaxID=2617802 RepID=UPI002AC90E38|nr:MULTISPECIES: efflux RND transporter periplasmic adaptor subunit [unclassified Mucilaginibacter]MEB0278209.1 efflux RND transporter periplasmic adaptor subunit [Mucilaginibacter sp. 10B2]MEB0302493.1 efflux RND transporter periplasmic adaptor subunit [Mucilaginibacter sp. 5C4]WPX23855.1 efflux RND transporter periplasmic adaptor subunit [Mucilaginibacter sp. 5C4]